MVNSKICTIIFKYIKKMFIMSSRKTLEIVNFEDQDHLLNRLFELISPCRHGSKYLLRNYKANDEFHSLK